MSIIHSKKLLYFTITYIFFIIYGSLVPFDYRPRPYDEAWLTFTQIPYLELGTTSRADWIANILLYIPLTFSLAGLFLKKIKSSLFLTSIIIVLIILFSIALAFTIEFYQQFFAPRTVSQNDLIAETIGSLTGILLWFLFSKHLHKLHSFIQFGGKEAIIASATLYILFYLALSFFPFDFVTSLEELKNKFSNGNDALFISSSCGGLVFCTTKLAIEVFLAIPLGFMLSFILLRWHPNKYSAAILVGLFLGVFLEAIQLFLVSGVAQGISILTRILGVLLGTILHTRFAEIRKIFIGVNFKQAIIFLFVPYILLVAYLNGWSLSTHSLTLPDNEKLDKISFLPFYYHYFSTESAALISLLSITAMYFPVGLATWLWNIKNQFDYKITAGMIALGLCLVMETGKLFILNKHPDPTNLLISFASALLTFWVIEQAYQWFHQSQNINHRTPKSDVTFNSAIAQKDETYLVPNNQKVNLFGKIIAFIIIAVLFWKIFDYPGNQVLLITILIIYTLILQKFSQAWLIVIPALLPVADLSPWTGRFFFSEFDYFIILTLAVSIWNNRWITPVKVIKPSVLIIFCLYLLLYIASLLQGLFPWQTIDANSFTNYYSHYNSLRLAKGILWAIFLLPLIAYAHEQDKSKNLLRYFIYGILTGLTLTVILGIWERYTFTGLFDYASDFRITSSFHSMHTGGAHLDAYLLLTMPFIAALFIQSKNQLVRFIVVPLLFTLSLYILLVTYSRGAYIAFVLACIILFISLIFAYKNVLGSQWKKILWLPVFLVILALVASPVLQDTFIQSRFNQTAQEANIRSNHWLNAIDMMDSDLFTYSFGMGKGSFPRTYLLNNYINKPATFMIKHEKDTSHLQFSPGTPVYIEQLIDINSFTDYKLKLEYRIHSNKSGLKILICEKAVQHSFSCKTIELATLKNNPLWNKFEHTFNSQIIGESNRPIKLILYNHNRDSTIDIRNIVLSKTDDMNLIKNGGFSQAMDYWFFTADDLIPWRIENLWIQMLFEQGWLGLITFNLLWLYSIILLFQQLSKQNYFSAITLSSFGGFLVISIINSSFDMPNITLLFFMLLFVSVINNKTLSNKRNIQ